MADETTTQFRLDLDSAEFNTKLDEVNQKLNDIHGDTHITGIATMFTALTEGAEVAGEAIKKLGEVAEYVFDKVLEAEKLNGINFQFEQLTKNAGLSSEALKEGFEKASAGLVPMSEILGSANKAIGNLGFSASKLPQLLDAARKSAQLTGHDTVEVFNSLARAIEFGNTRLLRGEGILVNNKKALDDYARSIGVSVESLTPALKQQALMNAVLDYANKTLVDTPPKIRAVTNAWAHFKTTLAENAEKTASYFNTVLSGPIVALLHKLETTSFTLVNIFRMLTGETKKTGDEIKRTVAGMGELHEAESKNMVQQQEINKARATEHEKRLKDQLKDDKAYLDERLKLEKATEAATEKVIKTEEDAKKAARGREKVIGQQYFADIRAIDDLELKDKQKVLALKQAADKKYTAELLKSQKTYQTEVKKLEKESFDYRLAAQNAFSSNYMQSIKDMVSGQKDAGEAIKGFFLGSLGDMAMKQGEFMVLDAFKTFPFINFPELGAGGALIALGAELGSLGGGSSGQAASAAGGGYSAGLPAGGTSVTPGVGTDTSAALNANAAPKSSVTIAVSGNYFETEDTKRRLAEIIREHQDATDFTFKQIGQA